MPTSEVVKVIHDSMALIGNALAYIAQCRRQAIIDKVKPTCPQLAGFMKEICKDGLEETGKKLFGPELKKKMNERADTIKTFNKALVTLDPPGTSKQKPQHTKNVRFLGERPGGEVQRQPRPEFQAVQHTKSFPTQRQEQATIQTSVQEEQPRAISAKAATPVHICEGSTVCIVFKDNAAQIIIQHQ